MTALTWLLDAATLLAPVSCAGCGRPDVGVCAECRRQLVPRVRTVMLRGVDPGGGGGWGAGAGAGAGACAGAGAGEAGPPPTGFGAGGLRVRAALEYAGVVSALLSAAKEHGRTDVLSVLAVPLGEVLRELLGELLIESPPAVEERDRAGRVLLVTMPSAARARRVRGYRPVDVLVRRAGFRVSRRPGLLLAREVADQAGLSASGRRHNLQGSMRASPAVGGRRVLLVDDVVTTGSTLLEAARAVRSMGGSVTGAACLAHTARRIGAHDEASGRTQ